ncbi:MAG: hypothetical protein AMXMBFR84_21810 [Candidatus Hydrogenedentota bacterium]
MTRIGTVIWAKHRMAVQQVLSVRNESKLKVAVVSVSAFMLWAGAFVAFYAGFAWLISYGQDPTLGLSIGSIIMTRLLSVFALALFFMLLFSNVLIAFSTLYKSREVPYLLHTPLTFWEFFLARFAECVVFSSWASAFLGSPLILAYGLVIDAPVAFYIAALAFYLPYVTIPAALGAIVAILLVRIFPKLPRSSMVGAAMIASFFMFLYLRTVLRELSGAEASMASILEALNRTQSSWMPSYWAASGVLATTQGEYGQALYHFGLLLSNALFLVLFAAILAQRIYYPGWSALLGHGDSKRPPGRGWLSSIDRLFLLLRDPVRSLVIKDVRLFWRDPVQWSQFIIFFGIMAVYIASLRTRSGTYSSEAFRNWVVCVNMGACTLILATLTSRFVFPLISLEGRRFWIIGLAPLTFKTLVLQKFWLSVLTASVFTVTLVIISCMSLRVEPLVFALSLYTIIITNFALSGLAVGLGSLYPNFQEDNPARIVSGMGGTLNLLLSMAYIAIVIGAQTFILQWRALGFYADVRAFWFALGAVLTLVTALSVLCTFVPMRLGLKNLTRAEY